MAKRKGDHKSSRTPRPSKKASCDSKASFASFSIVLPMVLAVLITGAASGLSGYIIGAGGRGHSVRMPIEPLNDTVAKQIAELEGHLTTVEERNESLEGRLGSAIEQLENAKAMIASKTAQIEDMRSKLEDARATRDRLIAMVDSLDAEKAAEARAADSFESDEDSDPEELSASTKLPPRPSASAKLDVRQRFIPTKGAFDSKESDGDVRYILMSGMTAYNKEDYAEALETWLSLAQQGVAEAQYRLGSLFYKGRGVELNRAIAYVWLSLADMNGNPDAEELLSELEAEISGDDLSTVSRILNMANPTPSD